MKLVRVALPIPLNRHFDYLLPSEMAPLKGSRVLVPFGTQKKVGIVIELPFESEVPKEKLKPIHAVLDEHSLFTQSMWALLNWASHYYHAPLGEVLHSALPVRLRQGENCTLPTPNYFCITPQGKAALTNGALSRAKKQLAWLLECNKFANFFEKPTACPASIWRSLLDKGHIVPFQPPLISLSWQQRLANQPICRSTNRPTLNPQQSLVVGRLAHQLDFSVFLLNGVTGSGKTEVYLQVIEQVLERGQQVLVLVPEIGLTPQTITRFQARFNVEIDTLHSNLNDVQRLSVWLRAKHGENAIVIGTRSALFTQFSNLGLIIIDEEHDASFKQQEGWRYHARDLAILRAKNSNIPIILGSATPSLESLYNVQQGKFIELSLNIRAGNAKFANQRVIDLKTQRLFSGISEGLLAMMKNHLEKGNQVMLFLNRRGFAPVLLCHECGWICECQACEKAYTYHQKQRVLRCHHCTAQSVIPRQCGHCGSTHLITTGIGTEQIEQVLTQYFPQYAIARIDRDSTARKGELENQLKMIQSGKSQILIGTQMLAKGHHFPNVTLVALVNVDSSLFSTDFRAEERLAQLYVQVAGRAGRGEKQGTVVLQTHYAEHPLLNTLLEEGYQQFAQQALIMRKKMNLPPFTAQVLFRATGKNNQNVELFLNELTACLQQYIDNIGDKNFRLIGPFSAVIAKKAGHYRWQLLLQHFSRQKIQQCLHYFDAIREQFLRYDIHLIVDIDPQDLG